MVTTDDGPCKFEDCDKNEWLIEITAFEVVQVKKQLGIDLTRIFDKDSEAATQIADVANFVDVLSIVLDEQIRQRGLDDRQFARAIYGDPFDKAVEAFNRSLIRFFPSGRRQALTKLVSMAQKAKEKTNEVLSAYAEDQRIDEKLQTMLDQVTESHERQIEKLLQDSLNGSENPTGT